MWAKTKQAGFTIVELLVVIVVIGILAAITVVAYNGIQSRAVVASLTSDLANASSKLKLYQVDNSGYPIANDCSNTPVTNSICLKSSGSTVYSVFTVNNATNPQTFCLTAASGNSNYSVNQSGTPTSGACAVTNLSINPRSISGLGGWSSNDPATWAPSPAAVSGNPSGITTATKSQLASGHTSATLLGLYNIDGLANTSIARTIGAWAYVNTSGYEAYIGLPWPDVPTTVALVANTWTFVNSTVPVVGWGDIQIVKISGLADPSDYAYATGSMVVAGFKAYNYADGNSPGWTWGGAVNNSTSTGPAL